MAKVVAAPMQSYVDILREGLLKTPHETNVKALKNWRPSGLNMAILRRIQGYATGMQHHSTYVKSQKIVWMEGGNPAGEPVLLLHGFASNKENWIFLMPFLARRYRLFVPDLPGWGESTFDYSESYRIEDQLVRIEDWIERYLPPKFHVVGSSMGGGVAALLAVRQPEKIRSLTLMNALGVFGEQLTYFERELRQGRNHLITQRLSDVIQMFSTVTSYRRWTLTALLAPMMYQELISRRHVNEHMFHQLLEDAPSDTFAGINTISSPTFIFWGENDQILHASCAAVFKQLIPHAEVKILKGAGHLPMLEMPAVTARALQKFWHKLSPNAPITPSQPLRELTRQISATFTLKKPEVALI